MLHSYKLSIQQPLRRTSTGGQAGIAAEIGANVINGAACCSKYIKDDIEQPGLFDEWLIEIESMHEAMGSLKNFDEEAGEAS